MWADIIKRKKFTPRIDDCKLASSSKYGADGAFSEIAFFTHFICDMTHFTHRDLL